IFEHWQNRLEQPAKSGILSPISRHICSIPTLASNSKRFASKELQISGPSTARRIARRIVTQQKAETSFEQSRQKAATTQLAVRAGVASTPRRPSDRIGSIQNRDRVYEIAVLSLPPQGRCLLLPGSGKRKTGEPRHQRPC